MDYSTVTTFPLPTSLFPPPPIPPHPLLTATNPILPQTVYYKDLATSSTTEPTGLDLLIFPGDATFSLLPNKRVHVLKFNSSSHVHFFWAQDVDQTRDEEVAKKVNGLIGGEEEAGEEYTGMEVEG